MRPVIQTRHSAGADLFAAEDTVVPAGGRVVVPTGYVYHVPELGLYGKIASRGGLAFKHGIVAFHGTVDADFLGQEVKVLLFNHTVTDYAVKKGDRIAQIVLLPSWTNHYFPTNEVEREGGFGSTDEKD